MPSNAPWGLFVIRVGLAGVLIWFGTQELFAPNDWIGYVPDWAIPLSPVSLPALVLINGSVEVVCGLLILLGVYTRIAALFMGLHLILIASSLGYNATAVRDWGLVLALLGIALAGGGTSIPSPINLYEPSLENRGYGSKKKSRYIS